MLFLGLVRIAHSNFFYQLLLVFRIRFLYLIKRIVEVSFCSVSILTGVSVSILTGVSMSLFPLSSQSCNSQHGNSLSGL